MKKLFLVANWKSNKNSLEAHSWLQSFLSHDLAAWTHVVSAHENISKTIVLCPPFTLLSHLSDFLAKNPSELKIHLGAQNVSYFSEGAHTGEEPASLLCEYAEYVLIGHSERRKEGETDDILAKKVEAALQSKIEPIFCVQGERTEVPEGVKIIAYEPIESIGSGQPDTPEHANKVAKFFKDKYEVQYCLYGGSVTPENVNSFTSQENLNGVLVGGASLDPDSFSAIVRRS